MNNPLSTIPAGKAVYFWPFCASTCVMLASAAAASAGFQSMRTGYPCNFTRNLFLV